MQMKELKGIKLIKNQVKVESGIIDILGIDKDSNYVVIELKVVSRPLDLIYQLKAYSDSIRSYYKTKKVRKVAIGPKFNEEIRKELLSIGAEIVEYKIKEGNIEIK